MPKQLFGRIAPIYSLFYNYQKKSYGRVLDSAMGQSVLAEHQTIIDVGCGTGALCAALAERGFLVTGIDPEQKMIDVAVRKAGDVNIAFLEADVLKGLPFAPYSFDIAIASYVAHGLQRRERQVMYKEMARVAKHLVILQDFSERRSRLIDLVETLEGSDYFGFIEAIREEMVESFADVQFIEAGPWSMWYVGRICDY